MVKSRIRELKMKKKGITIVVVVILVATGYMGLEDGLEILVNEAATIEDTIASGDMRVTYIDVDQGDCTLIQTEEYNVLMDTGNNNQGETVVSYLQQQGVEHLDYLIFTHPDADHIGGGDNVLEAVEVDTVLMPELEHDTQTYQEVIDDIEAFEIEVIHPQVGNAFTIGDAQFTILCPEEELVSKNDINGSSLGIKLVHGKNSFVMCGDAEEESEEAMVRRFGDNLEADVLKCGHHGSSTATTDEFLRAVDPTWAVISCGVDNSYGHPHSEVISKLKDDDVQIYRTDKLGTIVAESDGVNISWSSEKR